MTRNRTIILLIYLFATFKVGSYNLCQLSNKEGLSNSAILSVCQDSERLVWIGTADGLNLYNGVDISVFKPGIGGSSHENLSGNIIEQVFEGEEGIIWINTNHGLNRYNKKTRKTDSYNEFEGKYYCTKTNKNELFVIKENGKVQYFDISNNKFVPIPYLNVSINDIQSCFIDSNNCLYIVTNKGMILTAQIKTDNGVTEIVPDKRFIHDQPVRFAFLENESIFFIDYDGIMYEMNIHTNKKIFIANLKNILNERGVVSAIIRDKEDYLVAFQTNGLIRLQYTPETEKRFKILNIDIRCGVFCLLKDDCQNIIWIGTDGQGLFMYTRDLFSFQSVTFENLNISTQKPIRTLCIDRNQNLWIGTKDDGIILINNFQTEESIENKQITRYNTTNSLLINNSVYAFCKSRRNLLWIGGDGPGLNYYSFSEKKLKKLPSLSDKQIVYIHDICETDDSTLWLASVGAGIYKVIIGGTSDNPVISKVKQYTFDRDEMSFNFFFTACQVNDSIIWFGNRGYGLRRLNTKNETFYHVVFPSDEARTINDILSLFKDREGNLWAGTSYGIVKISNYNVDDMSFKYIGYNIIEGLPNNTIHGIQQDDKGFLWLSTNGGLVRFSPESGKFKLFNEKSGLKVFEFSDGAEHKSNTDGSLFFGGVNGFVTITQDFYEPEIYIPKIIFKELSIYDKKYNINDFLYRKNEKDYLRLKHNQNFFSVTFIAPDYINGQNCKFFYNIQNFSDKWIENGHLNSVSLTNMPPGNYYLNVRCDNGEVSTDIYTLPIVVLHPWYSTALAYSSYLILAFITLITVVIYLRRRYRMKREIIIEKMNRKQKEEIYESKLRFFTNITHEFSTPLTLIYGPCERILAYDKTDSFIRRYAGIIMKNTERLYSLIQELIEFRRIETGHRELVLESINVSSLSNDIADSFTDLALDKHIIFETSINDEIIWNTDKSCLTTIISNLLSNAFKYTPVDGKITLAVRIIDDYRLIIAVSNTGKGIQKQDIPYVFDRYRVLENLEKQSNKGLFSRNGLGLAICHNMVKLLEGNIDVTSEPNCFTEFIITLPFRQLTADKSQKIKQLTENNIFTSDNLVNKIYSTEITKNHESLDNKGSRPVVFIIDDDPEMLWFISEVMREKFNVVSTCNPHDIKELIKTDNPSLIITDIMMPEIDGISLMKLIKSDNINIPFILLSAKNTPEEQTEGINAGAEAYISKPFNVNYLLSVAERLIKRQSDLKEYYNSPVSNYEFTEGKFLHKEQKLFYNKVLNIIDKNKGSHDFSATQLAQEAGVSKRQLYRLLKEISKLSPADLIKELRLAEAEKLLIKTRKSVEEIMYATGFNNRSSFYRLFTLKYGKTPAKYREELIKDISSLS